MLYENTHNFLKTDVPCRVLARPQLASNEESFNRRAIYV